MTINEEKSVIDLRDVLREIIKQCKIGKKLSNLNNVLQQICYIEHLANQEITKLDFHMEFSKRVYAKNVNELMADALKNEQFGRNLGIHSKHKPGVKKLLTEAKRLKKRNIQKETKAGSLKK